MTRIILIATLALTWLLVVAKPIGTVVEAWLLDAVVYGVPPMAPEAEDGEAPAGLSRGAEA